jgi:prepilin-type N-terminal cleavage/methylation domain-containing protein
MRKAFTLIELLVVIAIIAILAAILFPVFAQAKAAAKHTATLANTKELDLAQIMYAGDYDDNLAFGTNWNTGSDQLCYGTGLCFSTWAWVTQPYIKNTGILEDPLAPTYTVPSTQASIATQLEAYYVEFGYNYTYLSPAMGSSPAAGMTSRPSTYFPNPAGTVMISAKWANSENKSGEDWGTGFPGGMLAASAVDPPVCDPIPYWCLDGWEDYGFYATAPDLDLTVAAGGQTGGNSQRYANQCTVAWLDGHSKSMPPGQLAIGSSWFPTITGAQQQITDYTKYLWGAVNNAGN